MSNGFYTDSIQPAPAGFECNSHELCFSWYFCKIEMHPDAIAFLKSIALVESSEESIFQALPLPKLILLFLKTQSFPKINDSQLSKHTY